MGSKVRPSHTRCLYTLAVSPPAVQRSPARQFRTRPAFLAHFKGGRSASCRWSKVFQTMCTHTVQFGRCTRAMFMLAPGRRSFPDAPSRLARARLAPSPIRCTPHFAPTTSPSPSRPCQREPANETLKGRIYDNFISTPYRR